MYDGDLYCLAVYCQGMFHGQISLKLKLKTKLFDGPQSTNLSSRDTVNKSQSKI